MNKQQTQCIDLKEQDYLVQFKKDQSRVIGVNCILLMRIDDKSKLQKYKIIKEIQNVILQKEYEQLLLKFIEKIENSFISQKLSESFLNYYNKYANNLNKKQYIPFNKKVLSRKTLEDTHREIQILQAYCIQKDQQIEVLTLLKKQLGQRIQQLKQKNQQLQKKAYQQSIKFNDEKEKLKQQYLKLKKQEIDQKNKEIQKITYELQILRNSQTKLAQQFSKIQSSLKQKDQQIDQKNKTIQKTQNDLKKSNVEINKLKQQITELKNSLSRKPQQIANSILSQKNKTTQTTRIFQQYFSGQILNINLGQHLQWFVQTLQIKINKKIRRTKFLYRMDMKNNQSFHSYFDDHPHVVFLVKLKNGNFIGAYSAMAFNKNNDQSYTQSYLFSITNKKAFSPKSKDKVGRNQRSITWDQYFIVFGNYEFRIRTGEAKFYSNFSVNNGFFDNQGEKLQVLLGKGISNKEVEIQTYEIFSIQWNKQQ